MGRDVLLGKENECRSSLIFAARFKGTPHLGNEPRCATEIGADLVGSPFSAKRCWRNEHARRGKDMRVLSASREFRGKVRTAEHAKGGGTKQTNKKDRRKDISPRRRRVL